MRELEVLVDGHLKLNFADIQEFFEQDLTEHVRSAIKRLIEQALLAERRVANRVLVVALAGAALFALFAKGAGFDSSR